MVSIIATVSYFNLVSLQKYGSQQNRPNSMGKTMSDWSLCPRHQLKVRGLLGYRQQLEARHKETV